MPEELNVLKCLCREDVLSISSLSVKRTAVALKLGLTVESKYTLVVTIDLVFQLFSLYPTVQKVSDRA